MPTRSHTSAWTLRCADERANTTARLYSCAMNRFRPFVLTCLACLALSLAACGNRGPLVLPEDAPPPMPVPADGAAAPVAPPASGTEKDGARR